MLDRYAIKIIKWPLKTLAALPDKLGISANQVTITGFIIGLFTLPALAFQRYDLALIFIVINRLLDGLDGAIARRQGITDCGGFFRYYVGFYLLLFSAIWICVSRSK